MHHASGMQQREAKLSGASPHHPGSHQHHPYGATLNGTAVVEGETDMPQLNFRYGTTQQMELTSAPVQAKGSSVALLLSQLKAGTTYYYMLQGSNGRTTTTSNTMSFSTQPNEKPTMGTATILSHGPMSVIIGYEIAEDGGEGITETGCYYAWEMGKNRRLWQITCPPSIS